MNIRILLPMAIASLLSLSFCQKEPAPVVFMVTNKLTGEPLPNATITLYHIFPPMYSLTVIGRTDNMGHLAWYKELDSLPNPETYYFICESPGFYPEKFSFTDFAQKTFDIKMRQKAVVKFNLKYQNSTAPKSFFIYEQLTDSSSLTDGSWLIYKAHNKTELDELLQKPLADIANIKYHCFKIAPSDLANSPMPSSRLPDNLIPDQILEISGKPELPVYSFDVLW